MDWNGMESCDGCCVLECTQDSLKSPLHTHPISLWQVAPGLLKSHAAQVASSTIACGWDGRCRRCKNVYKIIHRTCFNHLSSDKET